MISIYISERVLARRMSFARKLFVIYCHGAGFAFSTFSSSANKICFLPVIMFLIFTSRRALECERNLSKCENMCCSIIMYLCFFFNNYNYF